MPAAASAFAFACVVAQAVTGPPAKDPVNGPIETDRPDFTETAVVVPKGWTQLEMGYTYRDLDGGSLHLAPELLARLGTGKNTEVRIGIPSYGMAEVNGRDITGFGDAYLGLKIQSGPLNNGDEFALIPGVIFPSGHGPLTSAKTDAELRAVWSRDLNDRHGIAAMANGIWTTDGDGKRVGVYQQTVVFSEALDERRTVFYEYMGVFSRHAEPGHIVHGGLTFKHGRDAQWDVHLGVTLSGGDRNPFVGFGYAVRY